MVLTLSISQESHMNLDLDVAIVKNLGQELQALCQLPLADATRGSCCSTQLPIAHRCADSPYQS